MYEAPYMEGTPNSGLYIQVALLPSILKPFSETMNEFSVKQLCGIVSVNKLLKKRMLLMSSIKQPLQSAGIVRVCP